MGPARRRSGPPAKRPAATLLCLGPGAPPPQPHWAETGILSFFQAAWLLLLLKVTGSSKLIDWAPRSLFSVSSDDSSMRWGTTSSRVSFFASFPMRIVMKSKQIRAANLNYVFSNYVLLTPLEIPIGYDSTIEISDQNAFPIGIVYRIFYRKSDQISFPINFLIRFYFRSDFPSDFCLLSDRISHRIFVHFPIGFPVGFLSTFYLDPIGIF